MQKGLDAFNSGDYNTALKEWRPLAETGDATAQYNLGVLYEEGRGLSRDYGQAVLWYQKAAEQGNAAAQSNLGMMYNLGRGVRQDYGKAMRWYRKAADQGYAPAQSNLGMMYNKGEGTAQDHVEALWWYRKAANQGHATGQRNLGKMYEYGMESKVKSDGIRLRALMPLYKSPLHIVARADQSFYDVRDIPPHIRASGVRSCNHTLRPCDVHERRSVLNPPSP